MVNELTGGRSEEMSGETGGLQHDNPVDTALMGQPLRLEFPVMVALPK